jgi:hypothetical protein
MKSRSLAAMVVALSIAAAALLVRADDETEKPADPAAAPAEAPKAYIDGTAPGWVALTESDFAHVNDEPDTWKFEDNLIRCTGQPVGVIRSQKKFTNLELVVEWRHLQSAGNSGVFLWASDEALAGLQPGQLPPGGIEVQVLDLGYEERFEQENGKKPDWFTSHGDVFPVGTSDMKPFEPSAPGGKRSFPRERHVRPSPEWNHYYVRAINGEVRLWVNGVEVSGGTECTPSTGYLCLESEGAPVEFRNLRIRELP